MTDNDYKSIMNSIGMPNSRSLLQGLQQVANQVEQEIRKELGLEWGDNYKTMSLAIKLAKARWELGNLSKPPRTANQVIKALEKSRKAEVAFTKSMSK